MKLNNISYLVGVAVLALTGQSAFANSTIDVNYLGGTWGYKSGTITPNPNGNSGTGVLIGADTLHNQTSNDYDFAKANSNATVADNFITWCVDPLHWLTYSSHYNVGGTAEMLSLGGFSQGRVNNLQNLANNFYAGVDNAVESAAFQLATWTILYGSDTNADGKWDFGAGSTFKAWNLTNDVITTTQNYLANVGNSQGPNHFKITYLYDNSYIHVGPYTQDMVTFTPSPVPLPAALPLMASALGMLGFGLRRRKASAAV